MHEEFERLFELRSQYSVQAKLNIDESPCVTFNSFLKNASPATDCEFYGWSIYVDLWYSYDVW